VADVLAAEYGVSWPTAHEAPVAAAAHGLPEPEPTAVLGIDETRFGSVQWILDRITSRRSDPRMTSCVDCARGHPGALLGPELHRLVTLLARSSRMVTKPIQLRSDREGAGKGGSSEPH
jgi:hypothetical protein